MKFSIITPTYNRPEKLIRAVQSILDQDYENWEMIIVNDSPLFDYSIFNKFLEENKEKIINKIKYFINEENKGVNYSRNFALDNISNNSNYFTFLDDDDYFNKETLKKTFEKLNSFNLNIDWLIENKFDIKNNKKLTINKTNKNKINYLWDYLITKRFTGDATHFINVKYKNIKFSKIKNAEEWFFFSQIKSDFIYCDFNSVFIEYEDEGLTNNYKNKIEKLKNTFILFKETLIINNLNYKLFIYFILRIFAIILK